MAARRENVVDDDRRLYADDDASAARPADRRLHAVNRIFWLQGRRVLTAIFGRHSPDLRSRRDDDRRQQRFGGRADDGPAVAVLHTGQVSTALPQMAVPGADRPHLFGRYLYLLARRVGRALCHGGYAMVALTAESFDGAADRGCRLRGLELRPRGMVRADGDNPILSRGRVCGVPGLSMAFSL